MKQSKRLVKLNKIKHYLDVSEIPFDPVNYSSWGNYEDYFHTTGRTGTGRQNNQKFPLEKNQLKEKASKVIYPP